MQAIIQLNVNNIKSFARRDGLEPPTTQAVHCSVLSTYFAPLLDIVSA
jgi:hypothetical protein